MSEDGSFFSGGERMRDYDDDPARESEPTRPARSASEGRPTERGSAAAAFRGAVVDDDRKPEPPRPGLFGVSKKARRRYEDDLATWEADRRARALRARVGGRSRTILVTNTKGGVGKTPTVLCLAHALAEARKGGVAAWEASDERGTLLDRVGGDPGLGIVEMLRNAPELQKSASAVALNAYGAAMSTGARVFGSPVDRDILSGTDVEMLYDLLSRSFELMLVDSANVARSKAFQQAVRLADAVVVPTLVTVDSITRALETLDLLEKGDPFGKVPHRPELFERTVVLVSHGVLAEQPKAMPVLRKALDAAGVAWVEVPFDNHIARGLPIEWERLSQESQEAWRNAAAKVMQMLGMTGNQ